MPRSVTITGTRSVEHRPLADYARIFADYLGPFATPDSQWYIGGARGIDSLSLLWLAGETAAQITVVVPGRVDEQPADARQAVARSRDRIQEIVELAAPELNSASFHARNRWMVDHTAMTIGFPLADAPARSGTWQTLNYTAAQQKPRLIVPV